MCEGEGEMNSKNLRFSLLSGAAKQHGGSILKAYRRSTSSTDRIYNGPNSVPLKPVYRFRM